MCVCVCVCGGVHVACVCVSVGDLTFWVNSDLWYHLPRNKHSDVNVLLTIVINVMEAEVVHMIRHHY